MMTSPTLCRIDVGRQSYFLQTTVIDGGKDGFELVLTDAVRSWHGKISSKKVRQLASDVNMERDDFINQTKKALVRQNMGELAFEYQMKQGAGDRVDFSWKKVMTNENIKFQLGSLSLEAIQDSGETLKDLLILMIENSASLRNEIHHLKREKERMSTERANSLKRLDKCVRTHEEMERELFSKFQVVLNDKKAKIRCLKQEVSDAKMTRTIPTTHSSGEESNHKQADDESEEYDVSTDEDSKTAHKPRKRTVASGIKQDSSLLLEEPIQETTAPLGKRRRRRDVSSKHTPSKPSIPKVSSLQTERCSTPGTPESGRVSATSSGKLSKSDPDADMLFEEL